MPALAASGVRKSFGDVAVLDGVDLTADEGEIVLLMGPNGAGKTVFASCLAGSVAPDGGRIEIRGYEPREARSLTSVSVQGATVDPDLTGRENLRFYRRLHPRGTDDWERLAERFELVEDLDRPVGSYSGGMAHKVELASALAADVPLYLLDEPASELDLSMLRVLHDELLELRAAGKTVLLTSHTPLDARIADRLAFLRDGRIVDVGPPRELLEGLPDVVRIRGGVPSERALAGERAFRRGDEFRGFLEDGDLEAIRDGLDRADDPLVERDPPSYTDLFNYYTYVDAGDPA